MNQEQVVLAYSGGLDTSCILKWLTLRGYRVVAYVANVGQHDDFAEVERTALATGAVDVVIEDLRHEFVTDFIFPAILGNAIYEGRYLLGTALARPLIARGQVAVARQLGAGFVSHGSTGKGNDQVRFELTYAALAPQLGVLAPWKDRAFLEQFQGRSDLLAFAAEHQIPVSATLQKPFSTDENLMHKSYESGVLEDPNAVADPDMFTVCVDPKAAPERETLIDIEFKDGTPARISNHQTGESYTDPLELFQYANKLGAENGIGRIDVVENRYVGIKSRGVYETPGGTILHVAHRDIEGIAMDVEVQRLRDTLSPKLAQIIYNGFWFSPEMEFLQAAVKKSQQYIDGVVRLRLYKGNVMAIARSSPSSLYDKSLSSMDIAGGFDQQDSFGFIRINSLRLRAHGVIVRSREKAARQ